MSDKFSSFQNQQLLVEGWRNYLNEQQQVPQQPQQPAATPIQQITNAANAKITQPGPDKETLSNLLAIARNPRNLIALMKGGGAKLVDAFNQIKQILTGDDFGEASKIAIQIITALRSIIKEQKAVGVGKIPTPGPLGQAVGKAGEAAAEGYVYTERILKLLGNGSVEAGLAKFGGATATIVLCGIILGLIASAIQTANPSMIAEITQLVSLLAKTNQLANAKDLSRILVSAAEVATTAEKAITENTEYDDAHLDDGTLVCAGCLQELLESQRTIIQEAKYQGRTVTLNKPMKGDVKKSKVYVKDPQTGNVKKVNFGDKNMKIKKNIPGRRKSFRARHNCANPGPKTKARYWSCKAW
jgi:hypothetical protein